MHLLLEMMIANANLSLLIPVFEHQTKYLILPWWHSKQLTNKHYIVLIFIIYYLLPIQNIIIHYFNF